MKSSVRASAYLLILLWLATGGMGCGPKPGTAARKSSGINPDGKGSTVVRKSSAPLVPLDPFPNRDRPNARFKPMRKGLPQNVVILNYHDIIPVRTTSSLWFDCSVQEFTTQLDTLTNRGCHFISIQQLYDYLSIGKKLPSRPVAITFADGYEGFFTYAIPILSKRHIPVAQFVHTGFVGSAVGRPKMTWTQLIQLDKLGWVTIGSQTVTHPLDITLVHGTALRKELVDSRETLEDHFHHQVRWLAYPNGKFDSTVEQAAKNAGYLMAFCEHQEPSQRSANIMAVNRYIHTKWQEALGTMP